jgi:hypothetical protein
VSYFIDWKPDAINGLTAAWLAATDKQSVNDAEADITSLLARDPMAVGSPLSEGLRELTIPPLVAFYSVDPSSQIVEVWQIGFFK